MIIFIGIFENFMVFQISLIINPEIKIFTGKAELWFNRDALFVYSKMFTFRKIKTKCCITSYVELAVCTYNPQNEMFVGNKTKRNFLQNEMFFF